MVTELALAPSATALELRRAWPARPLLLAATLVLLVYSAPAQQRRETILQLRDDVFTAMAHVSLTEEQTEKLDRCRQTLLLAAQSGRMRKAATRRNMNAAVKDIEKTFKDAPFQDGDRNTVREDIARLRAIQRSLQIKRAGR